MDMQVDVLEECNGFSVRLTLGLVRTKEEAMVIRGALLRPNLPLPRKRQTLRQRTWPLSKQGQFFSR